MLKLEPRAAAPQWDPDDDMDEDPRDILERELDRLSAR
jgi:hypothetical protein